MNGLSQLEEELDLYDAALANVKGIRDYGDDPVGYAQSVLGMKLTDDQMGILRSLLRPPYRSLVRAGHSTGKTAIAAVAVNWWYDSFDPGVVISTAPDQRAVVDLLWKEIRVQRRRAGLGDLMPAAPEMRTSPDHYAKGFTSSTGVGFVGRHDSKMLFVFDEAVGVDPVFWETTLSMWKPEQGYAWLAIFNPTDISSQAYAEDHATDLEGNPTWHQFQLDCLKHPNIVGHAPGKKPPIPSAVTMSQVDQWVKDWCEPIRAEEATGEDIEWPFGSGRWYRQGPIFLARCRGVWPSLGAGTIWSDSLWQLVTGLPHGDPVFLPGLLPEIGCDTARYGDDFTSIHVRWGDISVHHESWNGWGADKIVERLKDLVAHWSQEASGQLASSRKPVEKSEIVVKIDDDGTGGACSDFLQRDGYYCVPVGAATKAISGRYPNMRSELWFQAADRARVGKMGLRLLPVDVKKRLRAQCLRISYENRHGMRIVEPKEITKELIGRSPDDFDALNLAYMEGFDPGTARFVDSPVDGRDPWNQMPVAGRRSIFGV